MSKVQHVSAAEHKVQGSEACYTVDLAVGMCSCPVGDTGALCKHQLAASQIALLCCPNYLAAVLLINVCCPTLFTETSLRMTQISLPSLVKMCNKQLATLELASGNEQSHGSMQVRGIQVETVVEEEDVIEQASGSESYEHRVL